MSFSVITTTIGATKIAAATAGSPLNITTYKLGDGNGNPTTPAASDTDLVNTKITDAVNSISNAANEISVLALVDTTSITPFTLREVGIFDDAGDMIFVANTADIDLEPLSTGIGFNFQVLIKAIVSDPDAITVINDPNANLATQSFVLTITDALSADITILKTKEVFVDASGTFNAIAGSYVGVGENDVVNLPASPANQDKVVVAQTSGDLTSNAATVDGGTKVINSNGLDTEDLTQSLNKNFIGRIIYVFSSSADHWKMT